MAEARRTMGQYRRDAALHVYSGAAARADELGWVPSVFNPDDLGALFAALDVRPLLAYMKAVGTAVAVHFDLAAERWECAWVIGQCRYVGVAEHPRVAIVAAATQALA